MKVSKLKNFGRKAYLLESGVLESATQDNTEFNLGRFLAHAGLASALILFAAVLRFLPHLSNVTPILAIALLSGFHFKNRSVAVLVPLLAMFASDLIIGFHSTLLFVYLPILAVVFFGHWMKASTSQSTEQNWPVAQSFGWTFAGSFLFFLVSNFGVWETQSFYSHNFSGLMTCLGAGIPFFEKSLLGDLMFTGLVFSIYAVACQKFSLLNPRTEFRHGR